MARPLPPKVRLALPGSESPEVFNFYQIVSLLSGLYLKGSKREDVDHYRMAWEFASDSLLLQIGDAYDLWTSVLKSQKDGLPVPLDQGLVSRSERLARRIVAFEEHLTMWSPVSRWARILARVEGRLLFFAEQVSEHNPYISDKLAKMCKEIERRQAAMLGVYQSASHEEKLINNSYATPVQL
jgi:hypothetical protein